MKFKCQYPGCNKSYSVEQHLKAHMNVHDESRRFDCPKEGCSKYFATQQRLDVHLLVHVSFIKLLLHHAPV